jgi:YebC/PmpR family DNA-binding regulatory protein
MSGHSKWHNIRLRKAKVDLERGKIFTKLAKEIIVAARAGGGNPDSNSQLRDAVQRARDASVPQDNIKRAIMRGTGELEGVTYDEVTYEGYGPAGVAIMLRALTDNRNRTVSEIRSIFGRNGGNLGESGCVAWMFQEKGTIELDRAQADEDKVWDAAIEGGAEDVQVGDTSYEIITAPGAMEKVKQALAAAGLEPTNAEVTMIPQSTVALAGKEAQQVLKLMEMLEDQEDVQQAYANFDIADQELEEAA